MLMRREGSAWKIHGFEPPANRFPYMVSVSRDDDGNWKLSSFFVNEIGPPPS